MLKLTTANLLLGLIIWRYVKLKAVQTVWNSSHVITMPVKPTGTSFYIVVYGIFHLEIKCKLNVFLSFVYRGTSASSCGIEPASDFNTAWQLYHPPVTPNTHHMHTHPHRVRNHEMTSTTTTTRGQLDVERFPWLLSPLACHKRAHTRHARRGRERKAYWLLRIHPTNLLRCFLGAEIKDWRRSNGC